VVRHVADASANGGCVLFHVAAENLNLTAIRLQQRADHSHRRRFAGPVRSDKRMQCLRQYGE